VIDQLKLKMTAKELAQRVSASVRLDVVLIDVMANDPRATQTVLIPNVFVEEFATTFNTLEV